MKHLISINPYTGDEISRVQELDDSKLEEFASNSYTVFTEFRKSTFSYRKDKMIRVAEILKKDKSIYAKVITEEMGKLISEAEAEVAKCAWVCEYYAENAENFLAERHIQSDAEVSSVIYQPLGTILAVMPWNFPFWQVFRFAAPAIMAGNTVLLKHASNVQGCAETIQSIFLEAGFREGVFQNLSITSSKVADVIGHTAVKAVTLTGSESAGAAVASQAGKHIKKCVLELGGNNAFVVLKDADIEAAVKTALVARLLNSGQSCIAAKRFILEDAIHDIFIEELLRAIDLMRMGNPLSKETEIAPLFSEIQAEEIERQVAQSIELGAVLRSGGKKHEAFYSPTILTEVRPGMPVFDDETFGPVFAISRANSKEQALELSNLSEFGLGISVFTTSRKSSNYFILNAEEGAVFINGLVKSDPRLPFGGVKKSGYGRELSREGILEFVNVKTVWISGQ